MLLTDPELFLWFGGAPKKRLTFAVGVVGGWHHRVKQPISIGGIDEKFGNKIRNASHFLYSTLTDVVMSCKCNVMHSADEYVHT